MVTEFSGSVVESLVLIILHLYLTWSTFVMLPKEHPFHGSFLDPFRKKKSLAFLHSCSSLLVAPLAAFVTSCKKLPYLRSGPISTYS